MKVIVCIERVYFTEVNQRRNIPFRFLCANIGLPYLLEGNFVIIPYLCSRASSTRISSLRIIGAGRL